MAGHRRSWLASARRSCWLAWTADPATGTRTRRTTRSAAQWAEYDVVARADRLRGVRLRVDCGSSDPFAPGVLALRDALPDPSVVHLAKGCHDGDFWWHAARTQLEFLSDCLSG